MSKLLQGSFYVPSGLDHRGTGFCFISTATNPSEYLGIASDSKVTITAFGQLQPSFLMKLHRFLSTDGVHCPDTSEKQTDFVAGFWVPLEEDLYSSY